MELLGLSLQRLLIVAGVGVLLLALLLVLKAVLKLTRACLAVGCLGVLVVLAVLFVLMRGL